MKFFRLFIAMAIVVLSCSSFTTKHKKKQVYAFGVAASFNDSVVYFTEIQPLDSVKLNKYGFLPQRDLYAYQLKNHLEFELKKPDYTCMIYFSENEGKLKKEANKVKGKYTKNKSIVLKAVDSKVFRFTKPQEN